MEMWGSLSSGVRSTSRMRMGRLTSSRSSVSSCRSDDGASHWWCVRYVLTKTSLWKAFGPSLSTGRLWKTRPSSASETPAQLSICGKLSPNASFSRSHSATLSYNESGWETGGTICAVARCCRDLARMLPQLRKRHTANSVRNQNSESQRRQRRTDQHQHIHCILHFLNALPGFPRAPHRSKLDALSRRFDPLSFDTHS